MTRREQLKQDLDTVQMPEGTRRRVQKAMRAAPKSRGLMRGLAIAAAMTLFVSFGAGAVWLYQQFYDPDSPLGSATETPEPTGTPEPTQPRLLALLHPGRYTDTVELNVRPDETYPDGPEGVPIVGPEGVEVTVTLGEGFDGDGAVLTKFFGYTYRTWAEEEPLGYTRAEWFSADLMGDGTDQIIVCLRREMFYDGHNYTGTDVHVLKVLPEGGLVEVLTVLDIGSAEGDTKKDDRRLMTGAKADEEAFGIAMEPYNESALYWASNTCADVSLDEFEGRPALRVQHVPVQALLYTVIAWDPEVTGWQDWGWFLAKRDYDPRPEISRTDTKQIDTGTVWWAVAPTPAYGEEEIYFCEAHGFYNSKGVTVDPRFGPIGMEPGHGGGGSVWLYDPGQDELVHYTSGEGYSYISSLREFEGFYSEAYRQINMVCEAEFDKITYKEWGVDIQDALTGRCAVFCGGQIVTDFFCDNADRWVFSPAENLIAMRKDGLWGVIDKTGKVVVPFVLEHAIPIDNESVFGRYNGLYGVIDVARCTVDPPFPVSAPWTPKSNPADTMLVLATVECDFVGDGTRETVTLKCREDDPQTVIVESFRNSIDYQETLHLEPYMNLDRMIPVDLDGDGGEELMIVADTGASGGWGGKSLTVLTLENGSLRQLYAGNPCGFTATGRLLPRFETEITVTETGNTFAFPLKDTVHLRQDEYYSEDGELLKEADVYMDAICYVEVNPDNGVVEIGQYLWSVTHVGGNEFLVTELTFDKSGYTVVSQRVETYEYARQFLGQG